MQATLFSLCFHMHMHIQFKLHSVWSHCKLTSDAFWLVDDVGFCFGFLFFKSNPVLLSALQYLSFLTFLSVPYLSFHTLVSPSLLLFFSFPTLTSVLQLRLQQRRTRKQLADQGIMPREYHWAWKNAETSLHVHAHMHTLSFCLTHSSPYLVLDSKMKTYRGKLT